MKISTILITIIISCSLSYGQYGKDFEDMSDSEKMMMYGLHKKSPVWGVVFEHFIPFSGYGYSGNWKRGVAYKIGALSISVLFSSRIIDLDGYSMRDQRDLGGFIYGLYHIYSLFDVAKKTKKYNNRVYKEIFGKEPPSFSLNLQPTYQGANLTLAYKFD